tara:strand:- start:13884 stop:14219 length:336 start_codon:yes stop_codon:yes gene_type:complete
MFKILKNLIALTFISTLTFSPLSAESSEKLKVKISETELTTFTKILSDLNYLAKNSEALSNEDELSPNEIIELQQQTQKEMLEVFEHYNMTVDRYKIIFKYVKNNKPNLLY